MVLRNTERFVMDDVVLSGVFVMKYCRIIYARTSRAKQVIRLLLYTTPVLLLVVKSGSGADKASKPARVNSLLSLARSLVVCCFVVVCVPHHARCVAEGRTPP